MTRDQTFSPKHREALVATFAGYMPTDAMVILWRASHSATFAEDLRAILEDVVKPEVLRPEGTVR